MSRASRGIAVLVTREDARWAAALPEAAAICRRAAVAAIEAAGARRPCEAGVLLAGDGHVRALNARYRDKDAPTNVLSFPIGPDPAVPPHAPVLLGDVVLAFETVDAEAARRGKPLADHVAHLIVHGILHLLGHDHVGEADAERMERLEAQVLARLGVADPYRARAQEGDLADAIR